MRNETLFFRLVVVGLVVLVASMFAYIAWVFVSPIDLPFQRVEGSMTVTARVDGQTLHVSGTTDLPDDALMDWYLWRDPYGDIDWPSGQATVRSGAFAFDADLSGRSSGHASAEVSFSCDWGAVPQPRKITDIFGEHCEHLGGDQVYVDSPGDPKQLSMSLGFDIP